MAVAVALERKRLKRIHYMYFVVVETSRKPPTLHPSAATPACTRPLVSARARSDYVTRLLVIRATIEHGVSSPSCSLAWLAACYSSLKRLSEGGACR